MASSDRQETDSNDFQWNFNITHAIGIDLGTTFSSIAVYKDGVVSIIPDEKGNRLVPSVVAFVRKGREVEKLVGRDVTEDYKINPKNIVTEVKRLMGRRYDDETVQEYKKRWLFDVTANIDGNAQVSINLGGNDKLDVSPEEISSIILAKLKKMAEDHLKERIKHVVISVPVHFNDSQRQATKKAAELANLIVVNMIDEPIAGAIAYGIRSKVTEKRNIFVMDVGGGTTDVALLEVQEENFRVLAIKGHNNLGGEDFDANLVNHCITERGINTNDDQVKRRLKSKCEEAKRNLSVDPANQNKKYTLTLDAIGGEDISMDITRMKFEEINQELFKKAIQLAKVCLQEARLSAVNVDDIVPIGGSMRIPKLRQMLQSIFGNNRMYTYMNPDEAVAVGATLMAAQKLGTYKGYIMLSHVTPYSLGTDVGSDGKMDVIIPRKSAIPCKMKKTYVFHKHSGTIYEPGVKFGIFQGENCFVKENIYLGRFELPDISEGKTEVKITFNLDRNGTLDVTAKEVKTDAEVKYQLHNLASYLNMTKPRPAIFPKPPTPPPERRWYQFWYTPPPPKPQPQPVTKQPQYY